MKSKFSPAWKGSKSVRKKRKYKANAPLHVRRKMMSSNLSKDLRKKHSLKSIPIRKGDEVKIMRGKFKSKTGKIKSINVKLMRVSVEKIQNQKKDGTKIDVYFHPSVLQIQNLNMEDQKRMKQKNKTNKGEEKNAPKKK